MPDDHAHRRHIRPKEGTVPVIKLSTGELAPGMTLARPVTLGAGVVLVQQDVEINDRIIRVLESRGIASVYVQAPEDAGARREDPAKRARVREREVHRFGDVSGSPWQEALCAAVVDHKVWRPAPAEPLCLPAPPPSPPAGAIDETIPDLAKKVRTLPTLPTIYEEVEAVTRDPRSSAADVARAVGGDPAFASALLRAANSALYRRPEPITTVTAAVSLLGLQEIRDLCLMTSVLRVFEGADGRRIVELLWRHAIGVGAGARVVGRRLPTLAPEELFLAGLLHDIGKLFWLQQDAAELARTMDAAESGGLTFGEVERERLGIQHTRLGRMIAQHWRLPRPYVEVIAAHHAPEQAASWHAVCRSVQVADALAHALELGGPSLSRVPAPAPEVWQALGLVPEDLPVLLDSVVAEYEEDVKSFAFCTDNRVENTATVGGRS
jgi:HD-like signal output (HDOD) protein